MRHILFILILFCLSFDAYSQLVQCRPKVCMIDYNYHNDNLPNADKTIIQTTKPDILIDNTPGGYWGQQNGGTGCLPQYYTPLGIQVFSYIAGGYEGTLYNNAIDSLQLNLQRVDAIMADSATGVFLDEVSTFPNTAGKAYITAIYNKCKANGLKLIINPGTYNFDTAFLMNHCDFIMTDELYDGYRKPSASEWPYLDRVLVVANGINNDTAASIISLGARKNGFGYSYACDLYTVIPSWIASYMTLITKQPETPIISIGQNSLVSNAPYGNQWYSSTLGLLSNKVDSTFLPQVNGTYYSIVTLQGCSSDTSNKLNFTISALGNITSQSTFSIYPNPARDHFFLKSNSIKIPVNCYIYNILGKEVKKITLNNQKEGIPIFDLPEGIYIIKVKKEYLKLVIKK